MKQTIRIKLEKIKKYFHSLGIYFSFQRQWILFFLIYLCFLGTSVFYIYQYHIFHSQELQRSQKTESYNLYGEKNNIIPEQEEEVLVFDFMTDSSYQKYVDPQIPFTSISYVPSDLRSLSLLHITDTRGDLRLQGEAASAFEKLAEAFYVEKGEKVVVVSSYRSYERQRQIKAWWCPDHLCAKAWYSEHQSGLAVDVWSASTEAYWKSSPRLMRFFDWFYDNAHLYGYHNSYQNGVDIDWYAIEPWHWRYVWVELATYLYETNQTFAQYYYSLESD